MGAGQVVPASAADNVTLSQVTLVSDDLGDLVDSNEAIAAEIDAAVDFGYLVFQVAITVLILVPAFRRKESAAYENAFLHLVAGMMTTYTSFVLTSQVHYGLGIPVFMIGGYQFYRFVISVFASGGASRGLSQFKAVVDTVKGWF